VWVQVEEGAARGLRRLTRKDELAHFRAVLRSRPLALNPDFRQRQLDVRSRLRPGTLQGLCEVVRDLSGRSWLKPLNEADLATLRLSSESLCREWAAADSVSIGQATTEVNTLLLEARRIYQV
jgi:RNA polymerase-interacting CarD/CdnL/TRCF family regulator